MSNNNLTPQDCGPEDVFDMAGLAIDFAEALIRLASFKTRFRDRTSITRDLSHMETLDYAKTKAFIEGFSSPDAPCTGHYFRGLIITYGMKGGNMINIYQAALMNSGNADFPRTYTITAGPKTVYNDGFVADAAIDSYITGYRSNMDIMRKTGDTFFTPYADNSGPAATDNAKSILYPLQEITAVWDDNGRGNNLYFHTAARLDLQSTGNIFKQEVIISPVAVFTSVVQGAGFKSGAGDAGHLCPPHCTTIMMTK